MYQLGGSARHLQWRGTNDGKTYILLGTGRGGAVFGASGMLIGIATAAQIRGYAVVIPATIAWASAAQLLVCGTPRRSRLKNLQEAAGLALPHGRRKVERVRARSGPALPSTASSVVRAANRG